MCRGQIRWGQTFEQVLLLQDKEKWFQTERRLIQKKVFTMRVVKPWTKLSRVDRTSLETFKVRTNKALSNLIQLKMYLLIAGRLD